MYIRPGQYSYCRHGSGFSIYRCDSVGKNGASAHSKIRDCATIEEARREVYRLNGWKQKTTS